MIEMKTIAEIQQDIRFIKTEIGNLDERLQKVSDELSNFKEIGYTESVYQTIYEMAKHMPIIKHPIVNQEPDVKGNYFAILVSIAGMDDSINNDQLFWLQRMIIGDQDRGRLENYTGLSNKLSLKDIIYNIDSVIKGQLARQLTLDLFLVIGLSRKKSHDMFSVLADIISIFEIDINELKEISDVSVMMLKQNAENNWGYETIIRVNQYFGYYLSELAGWSDILKAAEQEKEDEEKRRLQARLASTLVGVERNAYERYGENWFYYDD